MAGRVRNKLQARYRARHGLDAPAGLTLETFDIDGRERAVWVATPPAPAAEAPPLLIVLHGAGGQGPGMASLTGLDRRGPAAGFLTVFPDGIGRVWNDTRGAPATRRREGVDDVRFLQTLVRRLEDTGRAGPSVSLTGISNGALMAEHLARNALLRVTGLGLVAGPGTQVSRAARPVPAQPAAVVIFAGTADPLVPYLGGPIGPLGRLVARRDSGSTGRGLAVAAEISAADWASANGLLEQPEIESLTRPDDGLPVTRMHWHSAGRPPVDLYRIEHGGHTWPGGAQYLPTRVVGPVAATLDATGIILETLKPG